MTQREISILVQAATYPTGYYGYPDADTEKLRADGLIVQTRRSQEGTGWYAATPAAESIVQNCETLAEVAS